MYINPNFVHIYDTNYLLQALNKPTLPRFLKKKIIDELAKRGVFQPTIPANNTNNSIEPEIKYYTEKIDDTLYICYNEFDRYF